MSPGFWNCIFWSNGWQVTYLTRQDEIYHRNFFKFEDSFSERRKLECFEQNGRKCIYFFISLYFKLEIFYQLYQTFIKLYSSSFCEHSVQFNSNFIRFNHIAVIECDFLNRNAKNFFKISILPCKSPTLILSEHCEPHFV